MKWFLLFLLLTAASSISGQKKLTVEDASGLNPSLFPATLRQLQWAGRSGMYCWVEKNALVRCGIQNSVADTLVNLAYVNGALRSLGLKPLKRFPVVQFTSSSTFIFQDDYSLFLFDLDGNSLKILNKWDEEGENEDIMEKTGAVAFTIGDDLFVAMDQKVFPITRDGGKGIVYGKTVHRNEWGIEKGTFWSPSGRYLAFYRMDESMVTAYPLVELTEPIATVLGTRYPMAGQTSHQVTVGIYDTEQQSTVYLQTGAPADHYLTNLTWDPEERLIFLAELNRGQDTMQVNSYQVKDGSRQATLFTETDPKYVEPLHGLYFIPGKSDEFLWLSRRDGFNHLYLYQTTGKLLRQVTSGPWEVVNIDGIDESGQHVFFSATKESPLDVDLYRAPLRREGLLRISSDPGQHTAFMSPEGAFLIDHFTSKNIPTTYKLKSGDGKLIRTMFESKNPLKDYNIGNTRILKIRNRDGIDLFGRLILPPGIDSTRKYPVIVYVYGGPHSQLITNSWLAGGGLFLNFLASEGYIVFTLDNQGTNNRGKDFEQAIFRNLGQQEVADQIAGIQYLTSLPYVDSLRIGLNGWSYGGFITLSMMLRYPGLFKAAVAGGPVTDWKYYEVMYGERYMDTPFENPEGYKNSTLSAMADSLQGHLLIIHGTMDPTVVWQNSLVFLESCIDKGKMIDYFVYPGHEHNIRGKDRKHLNQKILNYFRDYLE